MKKYILLLLFLITSLSFALSAEFKAYFQSLKDESLKADKSFKNFDSKRGEKIFNSEHIGRKGKKISCSSCHGLDLSKKGEDIRTGKIIKPLSPKANPKRLTKVKKVKKWLRRNFKDVYNREGTVQEKGDVLQYIMSK